MILNKCYAKMRFLLCIRCKMLASYQKVFAILFWTPDSVTSIRSICFTLICRYVKICVQNKTVYDERSSSMDWKKAWRLPFKSNLSFLQRSMLLKFLFQFSSLLGLRNALKYYCSKHLGKAFKLIKICHCITSTMQLPQHISSCD